MRFYIPQLTNTAHNFHLLYFFQLFGFKLIPKSNSYTHILLIANIYNYFNLNYPDALNSKNIKIYNFLNSNCPNASNSKKNKNKQTKTIETNCSHALNLENIKIHKFTTEVAPMLPTQKISKQMSQCFQVKLKSLRYLQFKKYLIVSMQ